MVINRRTALKQFAIIIGGLVIMPSSCTTEGGASIALSNLDVSAADEALLMDIVDTLIPETDTLGAKSLQIHLFVLKMLDDCHIASDQRLFEDGLDRWESRVKEQYGRRFEETVLEDRLAFMKAVGDNPEDGLYRFFNIIRNRTIQGYLNSEYVMKNHVLYELVPGRYSGYAPA